MLLNATNQPKSTVEIGYMCPGGLTGPPAVTLAVFSFFLNFNYLVSVTAGGPRSPRGHI